MHGFFFLFAKSESAPDSASFHMHDCFAFIEFGVLALLFDHRNALSPIQAISLPKPQPPSLSFSHTHSCTAFTLIGIDIRTVPPHVKASRW